MNYLEYGAVAGLLDSSEIVTSTDPTRSQYAVLVKKDAGIRKLSDLRGRSLLQLDDPKMCLAPAWLSTILCEERLEQPEQFFGALEHQTKPARVVLPVFFGQADACVTSLASFNTMCELNPQVAKQLVVLARSSELVASFHVFRKGFQGPLREKFKKALLGIGASPTGESVRQIYFRTAALALPCIAMSLLFSLVFAKRLTKPIKALLAAVEQVSLGDLGARAEILSRDELGDLGRRFNQMADRIKSTHDELERRQLKLLELKDAAESANEAKSQFLANMSHELRTPMNAVIGYSEMLIEEAGDTGMQDSVPDLQKIRGAGKHLLDLISHILDLSKIEAGEMELYRENFEVRELVEELSNTIQPLVAKNANRLTVSFAPGEDSCYSDLTKVRQVLFNLLSNACKFTHSGLISLHVGYETAPTGRWVTFDVKDSGIGMQPEQITNIFKAFKQADASTTRKYGGTGLGLTITRSFCEMLGGNIEVSSEPGVGTTFTVRLPAGDIDQLNTASSAEPPATQRLLPPDSAAGSKGSVLVVDDDSAIRDLIGRLLANDGWQVRTAENGYAALECAAADLPDLVLLDLVMPKMDGAGFLDAFRRLPDAEAVPVIVITEKDLSVEERRHLTDNVERIVLKGDAAGHFLSRVRSFAAESVGRTQRV